MLSVQKSRSLKGLPAYRYCPVCQGVFKVGKIRKNGSADGDVLVSPEELVAIQLADKTKYWLYCVECFKKVKVSEKGFLELSRGLHELKEDIAKGRGC